MIEHTLPWDEVVSDVVEVLLHLGETGSAEHIVDFYSDPSTPPHWRLGVTAQLRCRALLGAVGGDVIAVAPAGDHWTERHTARRLRSALEAVQEQMRILDEPRPVASSVPGRSKTPQTVPTDRLEHHESRLGQPLAGL